MGTETMGPRVVVSSLLLLASPFTVEVALAQNETTPAPALAAPETRPVESRWQTTVYGFAEVDAMADTTQSFGPAANNAMLARPGTYAATHPRAQLTAQNSLLGVRVAAPPYRCIFASAHAELDFFGVQTADATESTVYTLATVRMRLYYFKLETPAVDVLAGQYHDLFGWGGAGFYPASVAFLGLPGEIYRRQPQVRVSKTLAIRRATVAVALAAVRPVERDSGVPDLQAGVRLAFPSWSGIAMQGFGQPDVAPIALGLSAVSRRFAVAEFLPNPGEPKVAFGGGVAANLFIPILRPRSAEDRSHALSLTAEATVGRGISDLYTGLTGGALFPTLPNPGALVPPPLYRPNIDSGIVTFDANGNLETIHWRAALVGLQYYLPIDAGRVWVSANVSRLESSNIRALTPEASRGGVFVKQEYLDMNVFGAVTPAVQLGLSFQATRQWYGDLPFGGAIGPEARNGRFEAAARMFF
jgi:hypothetical protein